MKRLLILSNPEVSIEDERLSALAELMGIPTEIVSLEPGVSSARSLASYVRPALQPGNARGYTPPVSRRIAIRRCAATAAQRRFSGDFVLRRFYPRRANSALAIETQGQVLAINSRPSQAVHCSLPASAKVLCAQLSGQSFMADNEIAVPALEIRPQSHAVEIDHDRQRTTDLCTVEGGGPRGFYFPWPDAGRRQAA